MAENNVDLVDQNQCKHIYSLDAVADPYDELYIEVDHSTGWGHFVCSFCPDCGKDLRKEQPNA